MNNKIDLTGWVVDLDIPNPILRDEFLEQYKDQPEISEQIKKDYTEQVIRYATKVSDPDWRRKAYPTLWG